MRVRRKTTISDGMGGLTPTWATVGTLSDVRCRIRQLKADEMIINDRMSTEETDILYCSDISILASDVLWVTKRGETISDVFEVKTMDQRRNVATGNKKHMQIKVKRIL